MYPPAVPAVKLHAGDPLRLAGLRRAVSRAGLRECASLNEADMSVRGGPAGDRHPDIDIEVTGQAVVMRLERSPAPGTWQGMRAFVESLLGPAAPSSPAAGCPDGEGHGPAPST